jgi:hypothetical protein
LNVNGAERLYKNVRENPPDIVALQGSRVYGNPRRKSDLDVIEVYHDVKKMEYEHLDSDGVDVSILKTSMDRIEEDIKESKYGNYLALRLCRLNKPLRGEKEILRLERMAMERLLVEGMRRSNAEYITPSYGMKLITIMRMWYEPQRWWSIYSSFINCPKREENIGVYYDKVERVMNESIYLSEIGECKEEIYKMEIGKNSQNRVLNRINRMNDVFDFIKTQILASNLKHVLKEFYPKFYSLNMGLFVGRWTYPDLFNF